MFEFLFSSLRPKELARRIRKRWPASRRPMVDEDVLRQEQLFSESVIDSLPGVFYLFDIDGNPLRWNRNVERMTGYSNEEIAAMHPLEFIVDEDRQKAKERIQEVFERGQSQEELSLKTKDGRIIPLLFTGIRMKQGDRLCLAGVGIDITDRKRVEQALRQSEEALQEADRRKNEFLAMLGHELRNPLMPIRTGLDLLSLDNDRDAEVTEAMRAQLEHLTRLVDDLLDVSRIVQRKIVLRKEPVELASIARQAVDSVRWSVEQQQQRLVISLPDEPVWLDADSVRLVQVIQNLLSNASKYSGRGGYIELSVKREEDRAVIRVRDNGIGIDGNLLPHVFDLFTQSNRSLDRAQGGLGIGLTLSRQLVEMHAGTIAAHSEGVDKGSEFLISLPVLSEIEPRSPSDSQTRPPPARRPHQMEALPFPAGGCRREPPSDSRRPQLSDRDRICELEELHRRQNQFLRVLAHEIGNAVFPFQLAMEITKVDEQDASTQKYVREVVSQQVPALFKLAADLQQVSRIVRGEFDLNRTTVDVEQVVRDALQKVHPLFEERRHDFRASLSELPPLEADAELLGNVLVQLLENAAWYTEPGGQIALDVQLAGDEVVFEVCDSGIGIPLHLLPQLFRPFVRAEEDPDFKHGRLGVGLALVRGAVELHGGSVQVDSSGAGKGSRFVVRLPLVSATTSVG